MLKEKIEYRDALYAKVKKEIEKELIEQDKVLEEFEKFKEEIKAAKFD